jgi:pimeloyl-ACP methyl ester carboxylesterase
MHSTSAGSGRPLLLVHGLGSSHRLWRDFVPQLTSVREVIVVDMPGHGQTPAGSDSGTFPGLVRDFEQLLSERGLEGADMVGNSLGGRVVLELARRGKAGAVVALAPGGFWVGLERTYLQTTMLGSVLMLRAGRGLLPLLAHDAVSRSLLLAPLSARPWEVSGDDAQAELESYADARTFIELVNDSALGPMQDGPAASTTARIAIGWGRHDRLCWPDQALRAQAAFPSAKLHWFERSGHMPMWDEPAETIRLIRQTVGIE